MNIDKSKVFSVIVSYNPEIENLSRLVTELKKQGVVPIIVDNGTLSEQDSNKLLLVCHVILLNDNAGIAKAQNVGIDYCRKKGGEFIIFFDQDSDIDISFVDSLLSDYIEVCESGVGKIATIGPVFTDSRYGFFYKLIKLNRYGLRKKINPQYESKPFEVSLIISSGSLIPINVIDEVGYMDEKLFIDYVDTEWCLRAIAKGYKVYVATSARMSHAIGDKMVHLFGFNVPVHSPFRRYYRIRNALLFSRMRHVPLAMKIRDNLFNIIHQFILIITQDNKVAYFKTMVKAIRDGILNK
ncbi:rhamnosyltransferase [Serratia aquatilis]|uniref:Rhamnosyltransferase n=1 Tax=Serratia aquatilis TaxID=1737515 RepID=A0ABV6EJV1_9GAMM